MSFNLGINNSIIRSYKRLNYRAWYALAEFVDNSTQSWDDNRALLMLDHGAVEIDVTLERDCIRVVDNAMGMDEADLKRALSLGQPPSNTKGRSEFGLGMKTAACWFGDNWRIKTSKLGDEHEYEVEVDVERVARGDTDLPTTIRKKTRDEHYTMIEVTKLHRPVHHRTIKRVQDYISSMYRVDIRNTELLIRFNGGGEIEAFHFGDGFLAASDGTEYKRNFEHALKSGKKVSGWIGILAKGAGGRSKGGIATIRRGRVIEGQPSAWKPHSLFGDSSNDLINQRLVGELHLDEFGVSHTKDQILWEGEEELELEAFLEENFADFRKMARKPYKEIHKDVDTSISQMEIDVGLDEVRSILQSPEFADAIELQDLPPEEVIQQSKEPMRKAVEGREPDREFKVGDRHVKLFLNSDAGLNDHYYICEWPDALVVNINVNHPYWHRSVKDAETFILYTLDCMFDALAEWKCSLKRKVDHESIRYLKDGLLRLPIETFSDKEVEEA